MKHVIHKIYWNYEREEKWLNQMSAKGLALTDYCWIRYVFEDSQPGEYIYRIQLLENLASNPESRKYIEFVEGTGAECIATYLRWVYFRKRSADGPFELYSDIASKIHHYRLVRAFWVFFAGVEFAIGLSNIFIGLDPPASSTNIALGGLLVALGAGFTVMVLRLSKKIRSLKKQQRIVEA
jgi:hypothetical protein